MLDKFLTDGLDDTEITAEAQYSVNITKSIKDLCLSLHHNESNHFGYACGVKIYHFKAEVSG